MSIDAELFRSLLQETECQGHLCNCVKCEARRAKNNADMAWYVTVENPVLTRRHGPFDTYQEASTLAEGWFDGMDTSEARETGVQVHRARR